MPSIGNDIVDLSLIDVARSKQARFYSKILAPEELKLYEPLGALLCLEHYVWLCWAIKEATYKFSKRLHPQLLFSPPRTVILDLSVIQTDDRCLYEGMCSNGLSTVRFQSFYTPTYIHTVTATPADLDGIVTDVFTVDADQASAQTHARLLAHVFKLHPDSQIGIEKNAENVPTLMIDTKAYPVSIAHHGQYGSFAFTLQNGLIQH